MNLVMILGQGFKQLRIGCNPIPNAFHSAGQAHVCSSVVANQSELLVDLWPGKECMHVGILRLVMGIVGEWILEATCGGEN